MSWRKSDALSVHRRTVRSSESDFVLFIILQIVSQSSRPLLKSVGAPDGVRRETATGKQRFLGTDSEVLSRLTFFGASQIVNAYAPVSSPVGISPERLNRPPADRLVGKESRAEESGLFRRGGIRVRECRLAPRPADSSPCTPPDYLSASHPRLAAWVVPRHLANTW